MQLVWSVKSGVIAKLGIVEEEADECCHRLQIIVEAELMEERLVVDLLREANELTAIMVASERTARNRK